MAEVAFVEDASEIVVEPEAILFGVKNGLATCLDKEAEVCLINDGGGGVVSVGQLTIRLLFAEDGVLPAVLVEVWCLLRRSDVRAEDGVEGATEEEVKDPML